jgi:hypothetical protein
MAPNKRRRRKRASTIQERVEIVQFIKKLRVERSTLLSIPSNRDLLESIRGDNVYSVTSVAEWERDYDAGKYDLVPTDHLSLHRLQPKCNCPPQFIIIPLKLHSSHVQEVLEGIQSTITSSEFNSMFKDRILNKVTAKENKKEKAMRSQTKFPHESPAAIKVTSMMKVLFPNHSCINLELLESEPGLSQQFAHSDFVQPCKFCLRCRNYKTDLRHQSLSRFASDAKMSYSFIVAIEEGTKLIFHEVEDIEEETHVNLSVGDLIVWRFDTVHAGAAYERINRRVFGILEGQEVKYDANELNIKFSKNS